MQVQSDHKQCIATNLEKIVAFQLETGEADCKKPDFNFYKLDKKNYRTNRRVLYKQLHQNNGTKCTMAAKQQVQNNCSRFPNKGRIDDRIDMLSLLLS